MTPLLIREILAAYTALIIVNVILWVILRLTRQLIVRRLKYIKREIITFKHKPTLLKKFYKLVRQREPAWAIFIPIGYIFCALTRIYRLVSLLNRFELIIMDLINKSISCDRVMAQLDEMDDDSNIMEFNFEDHHIFDLARVKKEPLYTEDELRYIKVKDVKATGIKDCHGLTAIIFAVAHFKDHKDT